MDGVFQFFGKVDVEGDEIDSDELSVEGDLCVNLGWETLRMRTKKGPRFADAVVKAVQHVRMVVAEESRTAKLPNQEIVRLIFESRIPNGLPVALRPAGPKHIGVPTFLQNRNDGRLPCIGNGGDFVFPASRHVSFMEAKVSIDTFRASFYYEGLRRVSLLVLTEVAKDDFLR